MATFRRIRLLTPLFVLAGLVPVLAPAPAAEAASPGGGFTPLTPARILDTRLGQGAPAAAVGPGQTLELQVSGQGGVPATGVGAVALNVTVTQPTAAGYLTVHPAGTARPVASNLNFEAGQTVPNAVVAKLGTGGRISIFNSAGTVHLIVDVAGWHATSRNVGAGFTPVPPQRVFDSRTGSPIAPGGTVRVKVTNVVEATAVALNVTATEPTAGTYLTVFPAGASRPIASNLNVTAGQTRANHVVVKVVGGEVDIFNQSGTTHVVVDLLGFWSTFGQGRLTPLVPARVLDTRLGLGRPAGPVGPGETALLRLPGPSGVPIGLATAVMLNLTVTQPTAGGWLTVHPDDDRPLASNLNFVPGATVPNLVVVPLGADGTLRIYNSAGNSHVIVDVVGWFDQPLYRLAVDGLATQGSDVVIDPTSTYAYISNPGRNQVEVLRLADGTFEAPILVGSQPMGLDLTPAGDLLYVANTGSAFVSVVDVKARQELRRFPVPSGNSADRPYAIAVLANGRALLATTFNGSGFGAAMYDVNLATDAVTLRSDFYFFGSTTDETAMRASGDRMSAVITAGGTSTGPVFRYDVASDTFDQTDTATYTSGIATDHDGSVILLSGMVFDRELYLAGTIPGCGYEGVAVNAAGTVGYGLTHDYSAGSYLRTCDLVRFQVIKSYPLGSSAAGRLALSPDGTTLVGIVGDGLVLARP
jgi:YVTN family beta-propeller protein